MFILNKIRDEAIKNIYPSAITVKIINETNEYKAYDSSNNPITLEWNNGEGLIFTKKIELDNKFLFKITQTIQNNSTVNVLVDTLVNAT